MFSRERVNDYGSYSIKNKSTALLTGVFDKNFIELPTIDPNTITYKVFDSNNINFTISVGNSIYIPSHIFSALKKAYDEGNPYYTIKDIISVQLDISKALAYNKNKFSSNIETNTISYSGSVITADNPSGSVSGSVTAVQVNSVSKTGIGSRFTQAGVQSVEYQFYVNNEPTILNDNAIINQIRFLFEDTTIRVTGISKIQTYQNKDGSVIVENLPASTDVVKPVTTRVTSMDDYLKDVVRTN
jgi:hypothetical protein